MNEQKPVPVDPVRVAQVGVGYWGPNLLRNLVSSPRYSVRMAVEKDSDRKKLINKLYPELPVSSDFSAVCDDPDIEAIIIATPVASHADLAIKALKKGKHVLVEKPMATTVDEVTQIEHLSREGQLVAMVGHTFLFNNAVRQIKRIIDSGEIGQIRYIYARRLNLGRIRCDVDALWNLAPHDISIIQYWLDDPEPLRVQRTGMDYVQKGIDDVVFLNISYQDGIMANVHVSWLDPHKVRQITVVGEKKMIVYDDMEPSEKIKIYDKGISLTEPEEIHQLLVKYRSGNMLAPNILPTEALKLEVSEFIDQVKSNSAYSDNDLTHGRYVVEILEASNQSLKRNQRVYL